jgi:hypothetical protein
LATISKRRVEAHDGGMLMKPKRRWLVVLLGVLLLVFGLACLHYNKPSGLEHHRSQAERYNLPAPGDNIFFLGAATTALGAGLMGFALARGRTGREQGR